MRMSNCEFIKNIETKVSGFFEKYELLEDYKGNKIPLKIRCKKCNNIFEKDPMHLMRGQGCPYCAGKRKDTAWFKQFVKQTCGDEYTVLGEYITGKTKIKMRHNGDCNSEFEMRPEDFENGQRCSVCARKRAGLSKRKSTAEFKKIVKDLVGSEYTILGEYSTSKEKILMKHNTCGSEFLMKPGAFLYSNHQYGKSIGNRCPVCYGSPKKTEDEIIELISQDPEYEYIEGTYKNMASKFSVKHKTCGNTFETYFMNFKKGNRCPKCAFKTGSKKEKELVDFIKSIYKGRLERNKHFYPDENNKRKFIEADILLEDLKLIIEFNGIYWHSTIEGKGKTYHIDKTNFFKEQGYRTIQILEDEWEFKRPIVEKKLKHIFGVDDGKTVYARRCFIREITNKESGKLMEENHIQGNIGANYKVGMFYENELVAAITFGKPRKALGQKNGGEFVELIRYATTCNVVGGFSRLLKWCIKKYDFKEILTYADLRWSAMNNNVYEKNGFKLSHISQPNYFYYDGLKRYGRYNFIKSKIKEKFPEIYDENLTEEEMMEKTKYLRVYDCGNLVYKMTIKKEIS